MRNLFFGRDKGWGFSRMAYAVFLSVSIAVVCANERADAGKSHDNVDEVMKAKVQDEYGKLPLYFIANQGQMDKRVKFYEKGHGHAMFFTDRGIYVSLTGANLRAYPGEQDAMVGSDSEARPSTTDSNQGAEGKGQGSIAQASNRKSEVIRLIPLGARNNPEIQAEGLQDGKVNYFIGSNPEKWRTNIPTYHTVFYKDIYRGVDMRFYGNNRQLEYDIIVNPGTDPSRVQLLYQGIEDLRVTEEGDLEVSLKEGKFIQKKPYVYQEIDGKRVGVKGKFRVAGLGLQAQNMKHEARNTKQYIYGFQVASYDKRYPLVIDPVLVYSTYLGGSDEDVGYGVVVDTNSNAYIAGCTSSDDFPKSNALDGSLSGQKDVFITKINAAGNSLVYSTYLGGSNEDGGYGVAVDINGNAYITGYTSSDDFPKSNALFASLSGWEDAFVTKINASGSKLVYSTYLGGGSRDRGFGIAVNVYGNAYVTGYTRSDDFPTANAVDGDFNGKDDAFVTKFNIMGSGLVYSTYLGGSDEDGSYGIAVDASGNAYVTGYTMSDDFPTVNAIDEDFNGWEDAFVTKINASGSKLVYSTYLGGSDEDGSYGIAVDTSGNAYVTGYTSSGDFPKANAFDGSFNGAYDAFVTKINASGNSLVYSTYLGGSGKDRGFGIAVNTSGNAYVTGYTRSDDFPTANAVDGDFNGKDDAFVTKFNAAGDSLAYSTYLGGSARDRGYGIAVGASDNAYVTGYTSSEDFPTANALFGNIAGELQYYDECDCYHYSSDAFVTRIAFDNHSLCKVKSITTLPAMLNIKKGMQGKIKITVKGTDGCFIKDAIVVALVKTPGNKLITILIKSKKTNMNGNATFTIKAKEVGVAELTLKTGGMNKKILVNVLE